VLPATREEDEDEEEGRADRLPGAWWSGDTKNTDVDDASGFCVLC
jgi:hypothetical protein